MDENPLERLAKEFKVSIVKGELNAHFPQILVPPEGPHLFLLLVGLGVKIKERLELRRDAKGFKLIVNEPIAFRYN